MIYQFLFIVLAATEVFALTPVELKLYRDRHFIELEHLAVAKNNLSLMADFESQERDLAGCRSLHRGQGGVEHLVMCIKFINRETRLGLGSSKKIVDDLNILCKRLTSRKDFVPEMVRQHLFDNLKKWKECNDQAWEQVYLTVYANFDADPVKALAVARMAETHLNNNSAWANRTLRLVRTSPINKNAVWP